MKLILLSGGSGKRLWPLSNGTRSKQFLKVLPYNGGYESMVQRVVRQLKESGFSKNDILIATSESQVGILMNQLGTDINIVTEPERRDTFPAISLAVEYLLYNHKCEGKETVVVMPCDVYTEKSYFQTLHRMAIGVDNAVSDIVLMGIKPTVASSSYGYIELVGDNDFMVRSFVEKPSLAIAEELISKGAYWNGGVFSFRLEYLDKIVRKYVDFRAFEELRLSYAMLPKISFDYEVLEKANSVYMIPFEGEWSDIGSWGALSEKLSHKQIGNVTEAGACENLLAVNELDIPLLCAGVKDAIVVASPDGILVSMGDSSNFIKKEVDRLSERPLYEERRWGTYRVLNQVQFPDGHLVLTKELVIRKGRNISYQKHSHRDEVWTFVDGKGILVIDGHTRIVMRGDTVHIKSGTMHAVKAIENLSMIEVQSGDMLKEEDILRFDLDWQKLVVE